MDGSEGPRPTSQESPDSRQAMDPPKRKASPENEHETNSSKRAKLTESPGVERRRSSTADDRSPSHRRRSTTQDAEHEDGTRKAPASKDEEKKRGKRLFGGLLSTLNQPSSKSQQQNQQRRREIEQRQQEKAKKQREDDEKRLSEKFGNILQARRREQINFDEKAVRSMPFTPLAGYFGIANEDTLLQMKIRHSNLLARAHSIQTRAEPRIYYRPWKLTVEQEDIIDDQIADAKHAVKKELENFEHRRRQHEKRYGVSARRVSNVSNAAARSDEQKEEPAACEVVDQQQSTADPASGKSAAQTRHISEAKESLEDVGGDVVHHEEDMVMY